MKTNNNAKIRTKPEPMLPARWEPKFLDSLDARLALVKRIRQTQQDICEEVNADTTIKRMLVDRLSFLVTMLETIEAEAILNGRLDSADAGKWIQATNAAQGLARMLGINRMSKRVKGNLREYIAAKSRPVAVEAVG